MQVYVELAVLENFCMDFTLLYAAKVVSKNRAGYLRTGVGAALGAAVAVVVPLMDFGAVWAVIIKIVSGLAICLCAGRFGGVKQYLKYAGWFTAFTAFLGGALIAVFSLAGLEYAGGTGYLLSSVPIGIPLFCGLLLILGARRLALKFTKHEKNAVVCRIYAGQSSAEIGGFFDSGNKVYHAGQPVSVIPEAVAAKLTDESRIKDGVKIHTVAGSKVMKVFTVDRIEIDFGGRVREIKAVKVGISPNAISRAVLHCDLLE
ncbi:MAG: hypothetical protein HFE42_00225 [Clostridia bacterium]|jgi:hypothetical protein|nr:hypothetical protein [Clostridia bacterium]